MKKYDEIVEEYRRSIYSLRRLVLHGSVQQRTQVGAGCAWPACAACLNAWCAELRHAKCASGRYVLPLSPFP